MVTELGKSVKSRSSETTMLFDKAVVIFFVLTIATSWVPGSRKSGIAFAKPYGLLDSLFYYDSDSSEESDSDEDSDCIVVQVLKELLDCDEDEDKPKKSSEVTSPPTMYQPPPTVTAPPTVYQPPPTVTAPPTVYQPLPPVTERPIAHPQAQPSINIYNSPTYSTTNNDVPTKEGSSQDGPASQLPVINNNNHNNNHLDNNQAVSVPGSTNGRSKTADGSYNGLANTFDGPNNGVPQTMNGPIYGGPGPIYGPYGPFNSPYGPYYPPYPYPVPPSQGPYPYGMIPSSQRLPYYGWPYQQPTSYVPMPNYIPGPYNGWPNGQGTPYDRSPRGQPDPNYLPNVHEHGRTAGSTKCQTNACSDYNSPKSGIEYGPIQSDSGQVLVNTIQAQQGTEPITSKFGNSNSPDSRSNDSYRSYSNQNRDRYYQ